MVISILGIDYDFSQFPSELIDALQEFAQLNVIDMPWEQYSVHTDALTELAYDLIEWDESEDNIVSINYPHYIQLCLEGQDWSEFPAQDGIAIN